MLLLHGSWMPSNGSSAARFAVWGESDELPPRRRRGRPAASVRPHPFCADADRLIAALAALGCADVAEVAEPRSLLARLPSAGGAPLASPELGLDGHVAEDERPVLATWKIPALALDAARAVALLTALPDEAMRAELEVGDDLRFWGVAARLSLELLYRQRLVPTLRRDGPRYKAAWQPLLDEEADAQRVGLLARSMPPVCRALAWSAAAPEPGPRALLGGYLEATVDAVAREAVRERSKKLYGLRTLRPDQPPSPDEAWLEALRGEPVVKADAGRLSAYYDRYRAWAEATDVLAAGADSFRLCFRLDPPEGDPDAPVRIPREGARDWALQYLLQAADDPSLLVPVTEVWRHRGSTVKFLNRKFDNPQERLLAGLGHASRLFSPIDASLRTARPEACRLTATEARDFVRESALLLKANGFGVLVPGLEMKLGLRIRLGRKGAQSRATTSSGAFSWRSLVDYDWQVALGDQALTREEFETLAALKEPLVQVRGRWVELRPEQIEQALAFFREQGPGGQMSLQEALRLALAPNGEHGLPIVEVATEGWVDDLVGRLHDGRRRERMDEPPGFVGTLRPYQKTGVSWLASLRRYGLGACLADDMGLGKTVELIALLLHQRRSQPDGAHVPTLLICPTSVVGNWVHELARFAPSLRVLVHHGAGRNKEELAAEAARHDVVISTYALLHRDEAALTGVGWSDVVLDEAQNVKNASTKAAQAARKLQAEWRAALTGTPVENRLDDLWSLFQFLNPGYLGSAKEFRSRFAVPIERAHDASTTQRLKSLVSPFILRRLKSDRSIIDDLPEKNEMKVYCTLTREQATLYEAVVRASLKEIEEAEGIQRRGQILATMTKLKQICNHPALFLHDGSQVIGRSGKLARLGEMLEEVVAVGERALVFTQYAQMGKLLKEHLEAELGREALFLHGGTPAAERDRMVARFQSSGRGPHVFVLSIKAGGTGLNLTRANHVFHFDRWWNPAVENQATDRAFRIGQSRAVQVHKFICGGTLEESIDELIERKVGLSEAIVGAGETWITEMSTAELRDLFALRRDAAVE